jgi:hypothetical protein
MKLFNRNQLRAGFVPMPKSMESLPIDSRGYPVPFFVAWINGKPDHRVMDAGKLPLALKKNFCWLCGKKMEKLNTFVIGPMCGITRTISEPPSHWERAHWAAITCPFLTRPMAKRRSSGLADDLTWSPDGLKRNPGCVAVWQTDSFKVFSTNHGKLFSIGEPVRIKWICEGRDATKDEVLESVNSGIGILQDQAKSQGADAMRDLTVRQAQLEYIIETTVI